MSARGRWFTDDLDEAQQRALAQSGRVLYIDVPAAFYERWVPYDAPEHGSPGPSSFVVSEIVRRTAKVHGGLDNPPPPAGPGKLRLYRGTGPEEPLAG